MLGGLILVREIPAFSGRRIDSGQMRQGVNRRFAT
jgi:hypothetical protein